MHGCQVQSSAHGSIFLPAVLRRKSCIDGNRRAGIRYQRLMKTRKSVRYELDFDVAKANLNASCEGSVTDICTSGVWSKIRCLKGCHVSQTLVAIVPSRLAVWAQYAALEGKRPDRAKMSRFRRDIIPAGGAAILHPGIAEAENRRGWSLTAPSCACSQQHPRRAV